MKRPEFSRLLPRFVRSSYRGKVVLAAGAAALAPWLVHVADAASPGAWSAAAVTTFIAFALLILLLSRISAVARAVVEHAPEARGFDEIEVVQAGVTLLGSKVGALQHRWVQRHPLSGLPTREFLLLEIAEDLDCTPPPTLLGAIRFTDYDRLSAFDAATAELALKAFADRIVGAVGKDRPIAHVDRDCFAIWFRGASATSAATELQAICYAMSGEIVAGEQRVVPDIEVGAALYPTDGSEPAAIITRALVSLARPGAAGKLDLFSGKAASVARERFSLEQDLRHAIGRGQLDLHFQPVVDLAAGVLVGAEALLRWRHPEAGMVAPSRFIPILEDANLTDEIGMWTLNAACREARGWERRGIEGLKIAVNLSATQLRDVNLKQMIQRTLERHKLRPQALELELTETAATEDADRTFKLFGELRALGISLAIDDFGSGYSSLSYLKNLPFDKLKIDREFVVNVHQRKDSQAICRSLVELTRGLGLSILAEGVETGEELGFLRSIGCDIFQGYFFSRPLSADDFIRRAVDPSWLKSLKSPANLLRHDLNDRISA